MNEPLRIGIAGYGIVGKRRREVAKNRNDMQTVAVCDQYFGESGALEDGTRYYPRQRSERRP